MAATGTVTGEIAHQPPAPPPPPRPPVPVRFKGGPGKGPPPGRVPGETAPRPPARQPYDSRDAAVVGAAIVAAAVCALAANLLHLPRLQPLTGLIVIMT